MPPQDPRPENNQAAPSTPRAKGGAGPIVGIIIIVFLSVIGALYFWGAHLNAKNNPDQLPLIPASDGTTTVQ